MTTKVSALVPELEAMTAAFVKEERLPGASVGIVHDGKLAWTLRLGFADVSERRQSEPNCLYRIASITKTFTATAIMQLRDERRLDLDDRLVEHIPEFRDVANPFGRPDRITLRQLLSHQSGLQLAPPGADYTENRLEGRIENSLKRVREMSIVVPPGTSVKYSNLGFQLLGEVVFRTSKTTYANYVRERILRPLQMTSTDFEPLPKELEQRKATGYDARFLTDELTIAELTPELWADGGLWSTVEDLARWISFQLGSSDDSNQQILSLKTLREMHTASYLSDAEWNTACGIGWHLIRKEKVSWVQHSGGLRGFTSNICFDPKEKVGAIVLINGIGDAARLAMDLATIVRNSPSRVVPRTEVPASMPKEWKNLLGVYREFQFGVIRQLEWIDARVTLTDPSQPNWKATLSPTERKDEFIVDLGVGESGDRVRFEKTSDGHIASISIGPVTLYRMEVIKQGAAIDRSPL